MKSALSGKLPGCGNLTCAKRKQDRTFKSVSKNKSIFRQSFLLATSKCKEVLRIPHNKINIGF